jgi:hypothetical protein
MENYIKNMNMRRRGISYFLFPNVIQFPIWQLFPQTARKGEKEANCREKILLRSDERQLRKEERERERGEEKERERENEREAVEKKGERGMKERERERERGMKEREREREIERERKAVAKEANFFPICRRLKVKKEPTFFQIIAPPREKLVLTAFFLTKRFCFVVTLLSNKKTVLTSFSVESSVLFLKNSFSSQLQ